MDQDLLSGYQPYIFILIGLIVLAVSVFWQTSNSKLKQTGVLTDGIILKQGIDETTRPSNDSSFSRVKDKITVRFLTNTDEWITGVIKQDFRIFYTEQFKDGETIKVYYDKDNPTDFYVDTKQSELVGRLFGALIGLTFSLIGLYQVFYLPD